MNKDLVNFIWIRAGNRCEYCRLPTDVAWLPFQVDHIIAEKHGGKSDVNNLALCCYYCNSYKGPNIAGIDPQGRPDCAIQLFHPRLQDWTEHFEWLGAKLQGKTPIGRATIAVLRINDIEAVSFRELLLQSGRNLS